MQRPAPPRAATAEPRQTLLASLDTFSLDDSDCLTLLEEPVVTFNNLLSWSGTNLYEAGDALIAASHK